MAAGYKFYVTKETKISEGVLPHLECRKLSRFSEND
jgi:hypothetical protein